MFATLGRLIEVALEREWLSLEHLKVLIMDEADKLVYKLGQQENSRQNNKNSIW